MPIKCATLSLAAMVCGQVRRSSPKIRGAWGIRAIMALFLLGVSLLVAPPASADVSIDIASGLRIVQPTASPGLLGGTSMLSFRIVNENSIGLHLASVSTSIAKEAKLVGAMGEGKFSVLKSISIPATETLDLTISHLRYKLSPLTRKLEIGDEFFVKFEFAEGAVTVLVHVHEIQE